MPLTQRVTFKAPLRKDSRLRIPRVIRGQFKLETNQVLKVTVTVAGTLGVKESFFGKMRKDGSITIPPIIVILLKGDRPSLENNPIEVTLEPT